MARLDQLCLWNGVGSNLGLQHRVPEHDEATGGEDSRPGERIPVQKGTKAGDQTLFEIVTATRSIYTEAGALSWMRAHDRHDVRPWLLLAMFAEDARAIERCHECGTLYLTAWGSHVGKFHGLLTVEAAAADALASLFGARRREAETRSHPCWPSADKRAKELGIRARSYRQLRGVAQLMFKVRFLEACQRFHVGTFRFLPPTTLKDRNAPAPRFARPRAPATSTPANIPGGD